MQTHILIPNINTYGIVVLCVLSLGSFPIARHIHIRWLNKHFSFLGSNAIVKVFISLLGLCIVHFSDLFTWNIYRESYGLSIGVLFGVTTVYLEKKMIKAVYDRKLLKDDNKLNAPAEANFLRHATVNSTMSLTSPKFISAKGLLDIRKGYSKYAIDPDFTSFGLVSVIMVAISEEFLFRGYMLSISEYMPNQTLMYTIIVLSMILFASSHMANYWSEFMYKLPLAILTLVGFIMTGTLLTSIVTHLILNIYAYSRLKAT